MLFIILSFLYFSIIANTFKGLSIMFANKGEGGGRDRERKNLQNKRND